MICVCVCFSFLIIKSNCFRLVSTKSLVLKYASKSNENLKKSLWSGIGFFKDFFCLLEISTRPSNFLLNAHDFM